MSEPLIVEDLSPFGTLSPVEEEWLGCLQRHVRLSDHLIRLGEPDDEEQDFVVLRDTYGRWKAGRYIGELSLEGRRLEIRPRLGELTIERWLGEALNLIAVPETAVRQRSQSFMARLMGAVWCRAVDQASRHGPPAIRRDHYHEDIYVRGRLDVRRTTQLRAAGRLAVASVRSGRDLRNDVSRTMVAAERALTQRIGHDQWHTPRVRDVLPRLHEAVGARPSLPRRRDLERVRFSPITRSFKMVADLSWRIAQLQGFKAGSEEGCAEGLLLDVAELWELFVLNCMRAAAPALRVEHGTTAAETRFLMCSEQQPDLGLGQLKPDVIVFSDSRPILVADAKYKRLMDDWPERPRGVDRADLYQLASYLSRYASTGEGTGFLLYPRDPDQSDVATAEARGPWRTPAGNQVRFERLPLQPRAAIETLSGFVGDALRKAKVKQGSRLGGRPG